MKVHELKEILNNYDDTADVFFFTVVEQMSKFDYDIFYGGTDDLGTSKEKYTKEEAIKTVEERKRGHWEGAVCGQ